jgi:hypothetical protein
METVLPSERVLRWLKSRCGRWRTDNELPQTANLRNSTLNRELDRGICAGKACSYH